MRDVSVLDVVSVAKGVMAGRPLGARLPYERWQRHESGYLRISAFLFSARGYAIMCASTGKERSDAQEQRPIALAD